MTSGENSGKSDGMGIKNKLNILDAVSSTVSDNNFRLRFNLFLILNKRKGGGNSPVELESFLKTGLISKTEIMFFAIFIAKIK